MPCLQTEFVNEPQVKTLIIRMCDRHNNNPHKDVHILITELAICYFTYRKEDFVDVTKVKYLEMKLSWIIRWTQFNQMSP